MSLIPILSPKKWKNRYSLLFDGVNECININGVNTSLAATTVGTFSCWLNTSSLASTQVIIGFGDTNANESIILFHNTTTLKTNVTKTGSTSWSLQVTTNPLTINNWYHIAVVQDAVSPVIYVNGVVPAQTFPISTRKTEWFSVCLGLDNGRIGCDNSNNAGNASFVNGNLDEVAFFNTNLSATQILEIYNSGKPKNLLVHSAIANLVSYFRMGDGDTFGGTNWTLYDKKGTNNGTSIFMEIGDLSMNVV